MCGRADWFSLTAFGFFHGKVNAVTAEQNYAQGVRCLNGAGVEQSDSEGLRFFRLAAGEGHPYARRAIEELLSQ